MADILSHLPEEMFMEIFSWVPTDSVVNSKLVSKSWLALITELINDPSFVATHLVNTKKRASPSFIVRHSSSDSDPCERDCREDRLSVIAFLKNEHNNDEITSAWSEFDLTLPNFATDHLCDWFHAWHCDGIVCLDRDPYTIVICNPILHEYRIVLKLESNNHGSMGFVYDSRTNDYRVIRASVGKCVRAEVYSVRNDSWKVIKTLDRMNILDFCSARAFCWRGVCYFSVVDMEYREAMLSFDTCSEEFQVMNIPNIDSISHDTNFFLWDGSVAWYWCNEIERPDKEDEYILEIYVLDDGNSENKAASWKKQLSFGPSQYHISILVFVHNQFLIRVYSVNVNRFITYNVHTKEFGNIRMPCQHYFCQDWHPYEKSLVSVKRG